MKTLTSLKKLFTENKYFYYSYFLFLIAGAATLLFIDKGDVVLFLNGNHSMFYDRFFVVTTLLGDGLFYGAALLIIVLIRIRYAIIGLLAFLSSGLAAQSLKRIFDLPRPRAFFDSDAALHFVESVSVHHHHSFPSGHTASAFSLFLVLAIIARNKYLGPMFLAIAVLVALSRIYLLQHFFIDIYFGSILGVGFTTFVFVLIENYKQLKKTSWHDRPLLSLFIKKKNSGRS
jgi:membrane-associated phospholipid phosphatase